MKPGDKVQWTQTSQRGRVMSTVLKEGVIESITGGIATVKAGRNNRRMEIALSRLQLRGHRSEIDAVTERVREEVNR